MTKSHNRVGLGTFPLAGVFNRVSGDDARKVITEFISKGGYYIDTAPMYGFGDVEKLLGRTLADFPREDFYIVTKCGFPNVEGKTFQTLKKSGKYGDVIGECENSLRRLKTDFIDLYLMHSPDKQVPIEETLAAMERLQQQGKVKELGVSNVNLEELKQYNRTGKIKFIQNRFNLITRSINEEMEDYLTKNKIKLMPYHVLEIGLLTEKVFTRIESIDDQDFRKGLRYWQKENLKVVSEWVKKELFPISKKVGLTLGQLSIAWALEQKYSGFVIVGTTNPVRIDDYLKTDKVKLSGQVVVDIEKAYIELEKEIKNKYGKSVREFRGLNEKFY